MAQFLLATHYVEGEPDPDEATMQAMHRDVGAVNDEMEAAGVWVFADGLEEPHLATVVRDQGGTIVTTDGPFPEAKEQLGGFWVIEVPDRDAALEWAVKATRACRAPIEVRPFQTAPEG
jgi:hypothetical protein